MRITIVQGAFLPVPAQRGGAIEKAFHSLALEFAKAGHDVCYFSRLCDNLPAHEKECERVKHERVAGFDTPRSSLFLKLFDLFYTLRILARLPVADILITHTFWLPFFARWPRRHGQVYVHVGRMPKGQMRFYRHAGRLQTVSTAIVDAIRSELPNGSHGKISMVPYPLEPAFLEDVDCKTSRQKKILYAGRIHPEKGIGALLEAYLGLPSMLRDGWALEILGPWETKHGGGGPNYIEQLKGRVRKSDNVIFLDPVFNQAELSALYGQASIFVYPSMAERGETFGLAVLEAMARGCITLVSGLECFRDFIVPGENGFAFSHRVPEPSHSLRDELMYILHQVMQDGLINIRKAARDTAEGYAVNKIARIFLDDFERLVS
jgi:glycosyltransferase involved in cell wall biosynthesis